MARPVYSRLFVETTLTGSSSGETILPDASIYVVRDITWTYVGLVEGATFTVAMDDLVILTVSYPGRLQLPGHWEGRRVAPGPSSLTYGLLGAGARVDLAISGYELTP